MRRKLRWVLSSREGEQVRSGLSFGTFDDDQATSRAVAAAAPGAGDTLDVYVDGVLVSSIRPSRPAHAS